MEISVLPPHRFIQVFINNTGSVYLPYSHIVYYNISYAGTLANPIVHY